MHREADLDRLYSLLAQLEDTVGGTRILSNCDGRMDWPERGLYIFFSSDETRSSSDRLRITRIGTHGDTKGSSTTLWTRLRTHRGSFRGSYANGGNHRGSVFRLQVGEAMLKRDDLTDEFPTWAEGSSAGSEIREQELEHERRVSEYIRDLPFLWLSVNDAPGPDSRRVTLEKNLIGLVSNYERTPIDDRDSSWLGNHSPNSKIRESGLWNVDHVEKSYVPGFLDTFESHIQKTTPP